MTGFRLIFRSEDSERGILKLDEIGRAGVPRVWAEVVSF